MGQLAAVHADAVNRGSADDAAEIWSPDAVFVFFGQEIHGVEALSRRLPQDRASLRAPFQMTQSALVHVEGDKRPRDDDYGVLCGLYQDGVVRA